MFFFGRRISLFAGALAPFHLWNRFAFLQPLAVVRCYPLSCALCCWMLLSSSLPQFHASVVLGMRGHLRLPLPYILPHCFCSLLFIPNIFFQCTAMSWVPDTQIPVGQTPPKGQYSHDNTHHFFLTCSFFWALSRSDWHWHLSSLCRKTESFLIFPTPWLLHGIGPQPVLLILSMSLICPQLSTLAAMYSWGPCYYSPLILQ